MCSIHTSRSSCEFSQSLPRSCKLILSSYVGDQATSKSAEFVTALMFAQEYGILSASLEDRPSIPACRITFRGAPPDFTAVFRKWDRPVGMRKAEGKTCQILSMNDAIAALNG
jgi:hypothetical protein